jgi:hypothetical protein
LLNLKTTRASDAGSPNNRIERDSGKAAADGVLSGAVHPSRSAKHMDNYREILTSFLKRVVPALAVGGFGWWLLVTASGGWGAIPQLLFGMACLVGAATIVASPIAALIAEPTGGVYYPGKRQSRPLPMYSIPESKRANGLYEEAMAGFEVIAGDYPDAVKPYIEMIDISIVNLRDAGRANDIFQRGVSMLKKDEDKEVLATMYSAIHTRLDAKPSN